MMPPITKENYTRHELIGLKVTVIHSSNPEQVGIKGRVIDATKNMLVISNGVSRWMIPKDVAKYSFTLPDNSIVVVEGRDILSRPEERIKKSLRRRKN